MRNNSTINRNLGIILISLFLFNVCVAQNVPFEKDRFKDRKDEYKAALASFKEGDALLGEGPHKYKSALNHYLKAQAFNPDNDVLNYKLGSCYLSSIWKEKAIPHLEKAYKYNPEIADDIHLLLAKGYHYTMDFDKAIEHYNAYKQTFTSKTPKEDLAAVERKIKECNNGKEMIKNPVRVFIDNLGGNVNSSYADYTPVISADEDVLIFTTRRETSTGGLKDQEDEFFEDIFITYNFGGKWTKPASIGPNINTDGHDASIGLSPDGSKLMVYKDDKGDGNIYICHLEGEKWSKPEKMSKPVNSSSHESSATFSFDGNTIYFVSNRPDGIGGRDIWKCTKNLKGKWGEAINLGPGINTPLDEDGVFMLPDGKTMYFSSKGQPSGMGGYDIYRTTLENGVWGKPENIGFPINSSDDDVFFVMAANGKHGYFMSAKKEGFGDRDLYKITFLGPEKPVLLSNEDNLLASLAAPVKEIKVESKVEIKSVQLTILKGVVTDALTTKPVEASIDLIDNTKNEIIATFNSNSKSGKYLVSLPSGKNYGLAVKAEGYLFHSENFDIPSSAAYQEITKDIALKNVAVGSKIVLKNIFFDFDKATLRPESTSELERLIKLLNDVPSLKIEISGHTDNKGAAQYNLALSDNRSKSVVDYLVSHGIDKGRLTWKGYGLAQPIATNDTDEGRQLNRRTEFTIMSK